jgi:hypothetical protein
LLKKIFQLNFKDLIEIKKERSVMPIHE